MLNHYNMACQLGEVSAILGSGGAGPNAAERQHRYAAQAIDALRQAIDAGYTNAKEMEMDPDLDALRSSEAFQALLRRLELRSVPPGK